MLLASRLSVYMTRLCLTVWSLWSQLPGILPVLHCNQPARHGFPVCCYLCGRPLASPSPDWEWPNHQLSAEKAHLGENCSWFSLNRVLVLNNFLEWLFFLVTRLNSVWNLMFIHKSIWFLSFPWICRDFWEQEILSISLSVFLLHTAHRWALVHIYERKTYSKVSAWHSKSWAKAVIWARSRDLHLQFLCSGEWVRKIKSLRLDYAVQWEPVPE